MVYCQAFLLVEKLCSENIFNNLEFQSFSFTEQAGSECQNGMAEMRVPK